MRKHFEKGFKFTDFDGQHELFPGSQNTKHIPVFQTKNVHTLYIISGQNVLKPYPQRVARCTYLIHNRGLQSFRASKAELIPFYLLQDTIGRSLLKKNV